MAGRSNARGGEVVSCAALIVGYNAFGHSNLRPCLLVIPICLGDIFLQTPLKPALFGRKQHELDSPNLGGHSPQHPTPFYSHPLRRTEMGRGCQG
ncbi:hypothetical protein AVEN_209331-1 [Araneus ventricosus]|uniref:Uncharacterized protein n=1 Tax=Araneus ventricosus TaxID=182803 RepID=A0A4Y2CCJ1_ARAVE|nr:hypothetical protein AVEN_209331-1 [Araneus ventricosus]